MKGGTKFVSPAFPVHDTGRSHWHLGVDLQALARGVLPEGSAAKERAGVRRLVFRSIEINGTFYSMQRCESFAHWSNT